MKVDLNVLGNGCGESSFGFYIKFDNKRYAGQDSRLSWWFTTTPRVRMMICFLDTCSTVAMGRSDSVWRTR